jgi:hypothetical protein
MRVSPRREPVIPRRLKLNAEPEGRRFGCLPKPFFL